MTPAAIWVPAHDHVSQIDPATGSGENACWDASLARALFELHILPAGTSDRDALNSVSGAAGHGTITTSNPETTLGEADHSLIAFNIPVVWTENYRTALNASASICLVVGEDLAPAQYPPSWFGAGNTGGDHFILWLPFWRGASNWFNDPLAWLNGQKDCQYNLDSVAAAFRGAYILPAFPRQTIVPFPATTHAVCGLKVNPKHGGIDYAKIPANAKILVLPQQARDTDGTIWQRVRWTNKEGWIMASNINPNASDATPVEKGTTNGNP